MKQDYYDQILREQARKDDHYQALLRDYRAAETDYCRILQSLSAQDRELLERYISLGEELQYRMTVLACQIPREDKL